MNIAVIGLGYVGLPLALQFARVGATVIGLDIDPAKVSSLNSGRSYIKHISDADIASALATSRLSASTDFSLIRTIEALNHHGKPLKGSKILIIGLAYKADVDDERESPSYYLMDLLAKYGAEVSYYDPYIPVIKPTREHSHWAGTKSVTWDEPTISSFDACIISTAHKVINWEELARWSRCIIDTRNAMAGVKTAPSQVWKS